MKLGKYICIAVLGVILASGCSKEIGEVSDIALTEPEQNREGAALSEKEQQRTTAPLHTEGISGQGAFAAEDDLYAVYDELIEAARECVINKDSDKMLEYDLSTALLASCNQGILGYCIEDIDGNGVRELIIGERGIDSDGFPYCLIYELDTLVDGEPVRVLKGWERNRYYLCENGNIANEGSSGADYSVYAYYSMEDARLYLEEAVIYDGSQAANGPWFYSRNSEKVEEAKPISQEEVDRIRDAYVYKDIPLIPFEEYGEGEEAAS